MVGKIIVILESGFSSPVCHCLFRCGQQISLISTNDIQHFLNINNQKGGIETMLRADLHKFAKEKGKKSKCFWVLPCIYCPLSFVQCPVSRLFMKLQGQQAIKTNQCVVVISNVAGILLTFIPPSYLERGNKNVKQIKARNFNSNGSALPERLQPLLHKAFTSLSW